MFLHKRRVKSALNSKATLAIYPKEKTWNIFLYAKENVEKMITVRENFCVSVSSFFQIGILQRSAFLKYEIEILFYHHTIKVYESEIYFRVNVK